MPAYLKEGSSIPDQSSPLLADLFQDRLSKQYKRRRRDIQGNILRREAVRCRSGVAAKAESYEKKMQGYVTINQ